MLKIENTVFREKYSEINIRQRMYEGKSFITLIVNTEFFPAMVKKNVVSGSVEVKLDITDIHSIDDLVGKSYKGDIGKVTISVSNDGIWEHQTKEDFSFEIKSRKGRELKFVLKTDNCKLSTSGVMVSLFTTSTDDKKLSKSFDLNDFYDNVIEKKIGNSTIRRLFVKE